MSSALATFEPHRPRLLRIAYRMLGTMSDAEDLVQDAYVRWHESDRQAVRTDEALLVTMITRLAIDRQRRLKTERTHYHGSWLPEPWLGESSAGLVERTDDMGYATMVLLERLSPDERAAFLLREVFDVDYAQIAAALEKGEAACRKLVQRAKERLAEVAEGTEPRHTASREARTQLLTQLLSASRAEDASELERLLRQAVRMVSDGGGKIFAARYVLEGAARVATTLWRFLRKASPDLEEEVVDLAGEPVMATYVHGKLYRLTFVEGGDGQIDSVYMLLNPDKLRRAEAALTPAG